MDKETSSRRRRESDRETSKDHHHKHHRHHRSKQDDTDEERRRTDERREKSTDGRNEADGSRERRERERDNRSDVREDSVERNKRKERGEESEENKRKEKRVRGSEGNGREKRRFEDVKLKEDGEEEYAKKERKYESRDGSRGGGKDPMDNGVAIEPFTMTPFIFSPETSVARIDSPVTKVSSISKPNENKGVNSNRSHEVPGKSSTDGNAGKNVGLSLDALAKAKRALQMQKDLAERMKKIPLLNRDAGSRPQVGKKDKIKVPAGVNPSPSTSNLPISSSAPLIPSPSGLPHLPELTTQKYEAVKRAQELAAKMGFRQDPEFAPLINMFPGQMPTDVMIHPKPSKAPVLRLDALGREIDEMGNLVNIPKANTLSTLKVNINKQKKDAFQILKPELDVDPEKNLHFDARMGIDKDKLLRPKRMTFQFVEEGKWSKDAEIIKLKSQFGEAKAKELKVKQAQLAKAKLEPDINPNLIQVGERIITKEKPKESIPDVEWWDLPFLQSGTYGDLVDGSIDEDKLKLDKITLYVEHPRPIEPPAELAPPPPQPLKLTKKEQKKLRTQRRLAKEKERQEMIRLGILEPPKPKVKMSNLMKILGSEATQDPTKMEMEIRSAAAEREQAHIDRNIARKLTPAERREKKERKLFDDTNNPPLDTIVSVYKVNDISHPQARFKVDINAQENRLTGCAVISEGMSVVVVEGGAKSIKRYGKLMLKRIDWAVKKVEEDEENEEDNKPVNKCILVWQGSVAKPGFNRFSFHECRTEMSARKFFSDHGVAHYWDLAVNFNEDQM